MDAIAADSKNLLRWSRKGHMLAMDIAKGLVHLHANKVPLHPCPRLVLCCSQCCLSLLVGFISLHLQSNLKHAILYYPMYSVLVGLFAGCVGVSVYCGCLELGNFSHVFGECVCLSVCRHQGLVFSLCAHTLSGNNGVWTMLHVVCLPSCFNMYSVCCMSHTGAFSVSAAADGQKLCQICLQCLL